MATVQGEQEMRRKFQCVVIMKTKEKAYKRGQARLSCQNVQCQKMNCCNKYLDNLYDHPACCRNYLICPLPVL